MCERTLSQLFLVDAFHAAQPRAWIPQHPAIFTCAAGRGGQPGHSKFAFAIFTCAARRGEQQPPSFTCAARRGGQPRCGPGSSSHTDRGPTPVMAPFTHARHLRRPHRRLEHKPGVSPVQAAAIASNATIKCPQHVARDADSKPAVDTITNDSPRSHATTITSIPTTDTAVAVRQRWHN